MTRHERPSGDHGGQWGSSARWAVACGPTAPTDNQDQSVSQTFVCGTAVHEEETTLFGIVV